MSEMTKTGFSENQQELRLRKATSRIPASAMDEETQALQFAYASLADLLDRQSLEVDEAALVQAVLGQDDVAAMRRSSQESWAAMLALAASLLVVLSLAGLHYTNRPAASAPRFAANTSGVEAPSEESAWEDANWELRLEDLHTSAAELNSPWLSNMEASSWNADESLREMREELEFESL